MIWLVWRQHRRQLLFALIGLAALALVLVPTGLSAYDGISRYDACVRALGTADFIPIVEAESCEKLSSSFNATHETWAYAGILLLALPLLVGLFWGAPLVAREVEQGTHRLVWTQGITRRRWALTKLGLVAPVIVVLSTLYAVLVTWWIEPLNGAVTERFNYIFFDQQGVVPVAYTLFAVAVGVFAGTVVSRTLPAMATTLVAFLFARIAVAVLVRPNVRALEAKTALVVGDEKVVPNPGIGNWIRNTAVHAADGRVLQDGSTLYCTPRPGTQDDGSCGDLGAGAYNEWVYQPGDRFWLFQWVEAGVFTVLAGALLYATLRRVNRSLA